MNTFLQPINNDDNDLRWVFWMFDIASNDININVSVVIIDGKKYNKVEWEKK